MLSKIVISKDSLGEAEHITDDLEMSSGQLARSKTEGMRNFLAKDSMIFN